MSVAALAAAGPTAVGTTALAVVGPTAVGKTALAVRLAQELDGELVNADSRQLIRGLTVGTSAPTAADLGGVRCHLLAVRTPGDDYTVAEWVIAARAAVDGIAARGRVPVIVGGTGLYVSALVDGFGTAAGPPDREIRARRTAEATTTAGLASLASELLRRDPAAMVDRHNPRRVIRALELLDAGAESVAAAHRREGARPAQLIGFDAPRELHRRLVRLRAEAMFADDALVVETLGALAGGVNREDLARCGIGYAEALAVIDGAATRASAIDAIVARTLRYARAQRTWFARDHSIRWFERGDTEPAAAEVLGAVRVTVGGRSPGPTRGC